MKKMLNTFAMILVTAALVSCDGSLNIDILQTVYLDQVDAKIVISQAIDGTTANVTASLTGLDQLPYVLKNDQAVAVNGQALIGPDNASQYTRTLAATSEYQVKVTEPSKYVKVSTIAIPGSFEILTPASGETASLSGFTVTWSNPDPALKVELTLRQVIDGNEKVRTFGPYDDSGTHTFAAADLAADFFHGTGLTLSLTVTKVRQITNPDGFKSGAVSSKLSVTGSIVPGP